MIRYSLKCAEGHGFDSWFQSADGYEALRRSGHLTCPECGATNVEKAMMAPKVSPARKKASLTKPSTEQEQRLSELKKKIETESDYVGGKFAAEARAMHDGDIPHRPIYGEAKTDEAVKLIEDGVPVAPLPFTPKAKTN
ncbi:MAG: DUF1178 family protein [Pseudomonadota bacterium]